MSVQDPGAKLRFRFYTEEEEEEEEAMATAQPSSLMVLKRRTDKP